MAEHGYTVVTPTVDMLCHGGMYSVGSTTEYTTVMSGRTGWYRHGWTDSMYTSGVMHVVVQSMSATIGPTTHSH